MSIPRIFSALILIALISSCESKKNITESVDLSSFIYDSSWVLDSWKSGSEEKSLSTMQTIELQFDEEKKQLSGNDGCNNFFAGYKLDGEKLNIGPTGGTKKYCGDESSSDEKAFLKFLEKTLKAEVNGKNLQLSSDTDVLTFKAQK